MTNGAIIYESVANVATQVFPSRNGAIIGESVANGAIINASMANGAAISACIGEWCHNRRVSDKWCHNRSLWEMLQLQCFHRGIMPF